jgi:hypothetical protein
MAAGWSISSAALAKTTRRYRGQRADVFLGQARIVLTQLGDLSALLAEPLHEGSVMRQEDQIATRPVAVCRGGSEGTRSR